MKVKEMLDKLNKCDPNYDVILYQVIAIKEQDDKLAKIPVERAEENDWIVRTDSPVSKVFVDHDDHEVGIVTDDIVGSLITGKEEI